MMIFIAGFAIGAGVTGLTVYFYMKDMFYVHIQLLAEREKRAFREAGKLSKRIHKQRLMIAELKKDQPPKPKKAYVPQPTVSH